MNNTNIKIKKMHPNAQIPKYAKQFDAGADLVAVEIESETDTQVIYNLGIAVETPPNIGTFIFPRSSICKYELSLSNSVGVGDPGYRGYYKAIFNKTNGPNSKKYSVGDRVCQMVFLPFLTVNFLEVEELSESERGVGGYGSSGT